MLRTCIDNGYRHFYWTKNFRYFRKLIVAKPLYICQSFINGIFSFFSSRMASFSVDWAHDGLQTQAALREQMARYRRALQAAGEAAGADLLVVTAAWTHPLATDHPQLSDYGTATLVVEADGGLTLSV